MKLVIAIFVLVTVSAFVAKFYGRRGFIFFLCFTACLLIADSDVLIVGKKWRWGFTGLLVAFAIAIYIAQRKKKDRDINNSTSSKHSADQ